MSWVEHYKAIPTYTGCAWRPCKRFYGLRSFWFIDSLNLKFSSKCRLLSIHSFIDKSVIDSWSGHFSNGSVKQWVFCARNSISYFVGWSVHHTPWNTIIAKRSFNLCYCPCPPKRDWSCPVYVVYVIESLTTWRIWRWWITGLAGSTWFDWFSSMTPKMQRSGYFETSSSLNGKLYRSMLRE